MNEIPQQGVQLRKPTARDAVAVFDLVAACPPLDCNSIYCNLLQCQDFTSTSVLAESAGRAVGWCSGYLQPEDQTTLFIWQVAVREEARGTGLALRMLDTILARDALRQVRYLKATVTPHNRASQALFHSLAARHDAPIEVTDGFDRDLHFDDRHESEHLIVIGPIPVGAGAQSAA